MLIDSISATPLSWIPGSAGVTNAENAKKLPARGPLLSEATDVSEDMCRISTINCRMLEALA